MCPPGQAYAPTSVEGEMRTCTGRFNRPAASFSATACGGVGASAGAADRLSSLAANATGARRESIDDYDVSIFDVVAGTTTIG